MGLVRGDGKEELPCAAEAIYEGYLYRAYSGATPNYGMTITTSVGDVVAGIAEESSKDAFGAAKTLAAGDKASFYLPGCGKIVKVASVITQTWHRGAAVYTSQSANADGMVETSSSSAVMIGHYMGPEGIQTATSGQLIEVLLDVKIGGA